MPHSSHEFSSEALRLVSYCPVCELKTKPMMVRSLAEEGDSAQLVHVTCASCENAFLAYVYVNQAGASTVGVLTDLAYDDVVRFTRSAGIGADDVLAVREWAQAGDYSALYPVITVSPVRTKVSVRKKHVVKNVVKMPQKSKKPPRK